MGVDRLDDSHLGEDVYKQNAAMVDGVTVISKFDLLFHLATELFALCHWK